MHGYNMQVQTCRDRVRKLDAELRSMIKSENTELLTVLELIDNIGRLGLGYKFESVIRTTLETYMSSGIFDTKAAICLHVTALCFKLLRQYGFEVSQGILAFSSSMFPLVPLFFTFPRKKLR